ncbi:MAG: CDP-diacylglycerol--glycerol-3-phosphate 3-phosphatidyltransferase [Planctomycetales bacterium]|nr:CDP-diacylglycerol--glycerol-3-phosphate 3-phosphatidyltransferase [Planctomycetales bacterium]
MNVPNLVTMSRFILAIAVFALIGLGQPWAAFWVFLLAASTDWVDGWWARKYQQVTKLGRIFDPFVDKVIICGTFVFLAAESGSGIVPWMAVLVLAREMFVTSLRGFIEQMGGDFSANWPGKWKMVLQCAAVGLSLLSMAFPAAGLTVPRDVSIYAAMALTIYSGAIYLAAAWKSIVA